MSDFDSVPLPSLKRQRTGETNDPHRSRFLFLCLSGTPYSVPMTYSVRAIPIDSLLEYTESDSSLNIDKLIPQVACWGGKNQCYTTGCINVETGLYLIGGQVADHEDETWCYSFQELTPEMAFLDLSLAFIPRPKEPEPVYLQPMHSGKAAPIVVHLNGLIYVLAGPPFSFLVPDPSFECYHPLENKWYPLDPPPFFDGSTKYYGLPFCDFSYVVMGNKLCVSNSASAFAFDVLKEKWERCELFAGFYPRLAMKGDEDYEDSEIGNLNGDKDFEGDKGIGGEDLEDEDDKALLPFGFEFDKRACLFDEDILVGFVLGAESFMAAYQIVDGKVVRRQVLDNLNLNPFYRHYLLSLGNGLFCFTYFNDDEEDDLNDEESCASFSLVLFKLSRATAVMANDDSGSQFVNCELLKKLTWKIDQRSAYSPIYSFVM